MAWDLGGEAGKEKESICNCLMPGMRSRLITNHELRPWDAAL